jgi:hypothetical protein
MQVPSAVQPKSNPAILTPANCVSPEVTVADVEVIDEWVVVVEVSRVPLEAAVPGRHCEYQRFEYVQTYPLIQVVAPVHPLPPPAKLSKRSL